jgi:hypothetical protein
MQWQMKVSRLIQQLQECDPDAEVILNQCDLGSIERIYMIRRTKNSYEVDVTWGERELEEGERRFKVVRLREAV